MVPSPSTGCSIDGLTTPACIPSPLKGSCLAFRPENHKFNLGRRYLKIKIIERTNYKGTMNSMPQEMAGVGTEALHTVAKE